MQIELERVFTAIPEKLPKSMEAYRILYWFHDKRFPVEGELIYLPSSTVAKRVEGAIDGVV